VAAGDLAAQGAGLLDREQRRVLDGAVVDAEGVEGGEQLVRGLWHRGNDKARG
jgi:hypothetical protein